MKSAGNHKSPCLNPQNTIFHLLSLSPSRLLTKTDKVFALIADQPLFLDMQDPISYRTGQLFGASCVCLCPSIASGLINPEGVQLILI